MGAAVGVRVSDEEGRKEKGPLPWKYAWPNKGQEVLLPTSAPTPQPFGFPDDGSHDRTDLRYVSIGHTCYTDVGTSLTKTWSLQCAPKDIKKSSQGEVLCGKTIPAV